MELAWISNNLNGYDPWENFPKYPNSIYTH
jgi:hypothetical protein